MPRKSYPSIVKRFHGNGGRQRLADALLSQSLLSATPAAATALSRDAQVIELPQASELTVQGGQDNDIYFLLSGSVRVLVNNREIAVRRACEHVGELALIDITAVRSATLITAEHTVVARIAEPNFTRVANRYPIIWRRLAGTIAQRLRERNRFHPPPHVIPAIFIGSSSEALPIATAIHKSLSRQRVEARMWSDGVFQCSRATIEDLLTATEQSDFAILVLAADDVTISRGRKKAAPRDNTVFELGLFMGALSRTRTYVVAPKPLDIKIPTDLLGVNLLTFEQRRTQSIANSLRPVNRELMRLINQHGPK
jgi:predicted nucleotide-binding protein